MDDGNLEDDNGYILSSSPRQTNNSPLTISNNSNSNSNNNSNSNSPTPTSAFHEKSPERRSQRSGSDPSEDRQRFTLDLEKIRLCQDTRTTLMIRNIPNKYNQKMLLAAVDEKHKGIYDFFYLPIDFKNKCNVGYAFVNLTDPQFIIAFYQDFNHKKWEKFNSEKVCEITYARIQGKNSLVSHFQNSSLMSEDKKCRPIIFHSEGPNIGEQEPFPVGANIRRRSSTHGQEQEANPNPNPSVSNNIRRRASTNGATSREEMRLFKTGSK